MTYALLALGLMVQSVEAGPSDVDALEQGRESNARRDGPGARLRGERD